MSDTESFESVARSYDDHKWILRRIAIDRLKAAHDREIRDTAQREYHRGYEAGRHSMDAEHRAVAMRLHGLRFDGGSHENLSQIAYAIYPCTTGWTCESAAGLRDKLIELMGGVSELSVAVQAKGLACTVVKDGNRRLMFDDGHVVEVSDGRAGAIGATESVGHDDGRGADCDGADSGEQAEVSDGRFADDCSGDTGGSYCGRDIHFDGVTGYDELGNERHKAVCALRNVCTELDESVWTWIEDVAIAIGAQDEPNDEYESMLPKITDRFIHLLGGDQPSGIDVMREMDAESDDDGTCPNDVPSSSITDELRELIAKYDIPEDENHKWLMTSHDQRYIVTKAYAIADRIDARHYLTSVFAEASNSDAWIAMSEYDKLRRQRDELRAELEELRGHSRTCPESDEEVSESAPPVSITDELRECVDTATKMYEDVQWYELDESEEADHTVCHVTEGELRRIADRIDEQFDRICQQQEDVLQETIDEMVEERDSWKTTADMWKAKADKMERECDELRDEDVEIKRQYAKLCIERADLLDLLRDAAVDFKNASYSWDYGAIVSENITMETERNRLVKERDELRRKVDELEKFDADTSLAAFGDDNDKLRRMLSRAATLLANAEQDRDTNYAYWMDCKEKVVHANVTIDELQAKLDAIRDALDG